jgi:AAA family ATP:ADP antiporter
MTTLERWLARVMPATPQERAAALWSFAYILCASCRVLRPAAFCATRWHRRRRQESAMAVYRDLRHFARGATPLRALVARLPRARFIPIVYHFFVANLLVFWALLTFDVETAVVARVFFVWVSVFNLFAVAVFWSFMADLFTSEQGKRLFGFIGAGGTAGALLGPIITIWLSVPLGPVNLMIAAVIFLELAVFCVYRLERNVVMREQAQAPTESIGGQCIRGDTRAGAVTLHAGYRRLGRAPVLCRDHHLLRAGAYRLGGRQERGPSDADFCQHRPRG